MTELLQEGCLDGRVCVTVFLGRERGERERAREREFSGLKDIFQVFDRFVILSKSEEREDASACLSE